VLTADIVMAVAGAIFAPTVAAITLGLMQRESCRHDWAAMQRSIAPETCSLPAWRASSVGGSTAVFYLVPIFAVFSSLRYQQSRPKPSITRGRI
jgi:hypothetical protein